MFSSMKKTDTIEIALSDIMTFLVPNQELESEILFDNAKEYLNVIKNLKNSLEDPKKYFYYILFERFTEDLLFSIQGYQPYSKTLDLPKKIKQKQKIHIEKKYLGNFSIFIKILFFI